MRLPPIRQLARLLLALCTGVTLLLPEVGHSLAHHHAAEHRAGDLAPEFAMFPQEHGHSHHPHLDMVAGPPARPLFQCAAIVVCVAELVLDDPVIERPLAPVEPAGLSPGNLFHGPSPPSRAPPQV